MASIISKKKKTTNKKWKFFTGNNNEIFPVISRITGTIFTSVVVLLALTACGGGITGTGGSSTSPGGDGANNDSSEPKLILPSEAPGGTPGTGPESTIEFLPKDLPVEALALALASVEDKLKSKSVDINPDSLTQQLLDRLDDYYLAMVLTQFDINLLHQAMYKELMDCDLAGLCDDFPDAVDVQFLDTNNLISYRSIQLDTQLPGYFDKRLQYRYQEDASVTIQWSNGFQLISLYSDRQDAITYALIEKNPLRVTFRQIRKSDNAITQITLLDEPSNNNVKIEADFPDWYLKVKVKKYSAALFALSADEHITRREAMVVGDRAFLVENCFTADCVWQPEHSHDSDIFDTVSPWVGRFGSTYLETPRNFEFTQPVSRFVIANPSTVEASEPDAESIVCGGTTVLGKQRVYCWSPLPLDENLAYFEETTIGGTVQYSPIQKLD